ncbi:hypothetical protein, partial [Klebsiella pneumoniae]|uniref:hypothetical protein n=1 Tax=Klebsiella pneumoniae TaxID=573 RepID=UPI00396922D4
IGEAWKGIHRFDVVFYLWESYYDYVILALTTVLTDTLDYKNDPNSDKYIKQIICTDIALKVEYDKLINVLE